MYSTVLKIEILEEVGVVIMDVFVLMKKYIYNFNFIFLKMSIQI